MGLFAFIVALLMLAGAVDPTRGWLIALVALTGIAAFRIRPWRLFAPRPALDLRLAAFVLAALLLASAVEANRDWLIVLSAVTGVAAFMPRLFALDRGWRGAPWEWTRGRRRRVRVDWDWDDA